MNYDNPIQKDTVYVPRMGYVVLRFKPHMGLWMLHCHTLWHHGAGMGIAIQIGKSASQDIRDSASRVCSR